MDRTVIGSDRSPRAAMRFPVAVETQGMGTDQFPPVRTARTAATRSDRPSRAGAPAFSPPGAPGGPDSSGRALAAGMQSPRDRTIRDSSGAGTGKLMTR